MAKLQLRPYQDDIINAIGVAWAEGDNRACVWLPTGGGKSECAVALALQEQQAGGHTLFIVERKVLCAQGANRFRKYGMLPGIIRGEDTFIRGYEAVTVASIQTLKSRHDNAEIEEVLKRTTLIIVDEAHILFKHHDKLFERLPHARAVGLTATPLRDGLGLRYQRLIRGPSYDWMIENGFLVRPRYFMPNSREVEAGLKGVEVSSTGDYKDGQLSALMRQKTILGDVVGNWKAKAEDRQTITFCVDIAHSQALVDEFQTAGIPAEHIDCHTEDDDRTRIFQRFRNGETKVLCSVGVLALGFDEPQTGCVILARPTLSLALHIQQVGRGLRIHPGKTDALIFDHAGNIHRHGRIEDFNPPELSELNKHSDKKRRTDFAEDCKPCPNCSAVLEPKQRICHECGHEIGRKNQVDFIPAELTEAGREVAPGVSRDELKRTYRMNLWMSRAKGWRPGAAYMRTLERFKISPEVAKQQRLIPWGWKDLDPLPPDDAYQRWEQSRRIAYAKSRR